MSQFFSVYSLFVFFLPASKCLGYDEEALEMKMRMQKKKLSELFTIERFLDWSGSQSFFRIHEERESDDVRREKKLASVSFARL